MSAVSFTGSDKNDLHEFYRIYDFAKVNSVDHTVETCVARAITPQQLFDDLYNLHHVRRLPDRVAAAQRLREAVPTAADEDVESVLRQSEMKQLTECDALRALRRRLGVRSNSAVLSSSVTAPSSPMTTTTRIEENMPLGEAAAPTTTTTTTDADTTARSAVIDRGDCIDVGKMKQLNTGPTRAGMDEIFTAECRDWVARVVGDAHNADILHGDNFVDSLRSGVVLLVLLQKLRDPPVPDDALKIPKRNTGFYARDNIISFLKEAAITYDLVDAQLFTVSDLCDGKNYRAVVTCLLSIARIAYTRGSTKLAPAMILYEEEIDAKMKNVTQQQIDDMVLEGEASELTSEVWDNTENDEEEKEEETHENNKATGMTATETTRPPVKGSDDTIISSVACNNGSEGQKDTSPGGEEIDEVGKEKQPTRKNTGRVFYLRGGSITEYRKMLSQVKTRLPLPPPSSSQLATPSWDFNTATTTASTTASTAPTVTPQPTNPQHGPRYKPRRWDEIDVRLSDVVNAYFTQHPTSQIRFRRLSSTPMGYLVYHRSKGHRRLLDARVLQGRLVIRPTTTGSSSLASSWMDLQEWVDRYEKELRERT